MNTPNLIRTGSDIIDTLVPDLQEFAKNFNYRIRTSEAEILITIAAITIIVVISFILLQINSKIFKPTLGQVDQTGNRYLYLRHLFSALIFIISTYLIISVVPTLRSIVLSLFAGAGLIAIVIGFAAQHAFANIISGIFILIFKPFKLGERVEIGSRVGVVEDITLRHTVIKDFENRRIIIPNAVVSEQTVINSTITDERICKIFEVIISPHSNIEKAIQIIQEEAANHPFAIDNRSPEDKKNNSPKVEARLIGFDPLGFKIRTWIWAINANTAFEMVCQLNIIIKHKFDNEGISFAFLNTAFQNTTTNQTLQTIHYDTLNNTPKEIKQ